MLCHSCGSLELASILDLERLEGGALAFCTECALVQIAPPDAPVESFEAPIEFIEESGLNGRTFVVGIVRGARLGFVENLGEWEGRADVIHAGDVLAGAVDLNAFVAAIALLLKDQGVAVIEAPYIKDVVERCEFGSAVRRHYFSATSLSALFQRHGLYLEEVMRLRGGLRCTFSKNPNPSVHPLVALEASQGMNSLAYYREFSERVSDLKKQLTNLLGELKERGRSIAAYGSRASIFFDHSRTFVDYVVEEENSNGAGCAQLIADMPDYVVVLSAGDRIFSQQREYLERGGRFVVALPTPSIASIVR